MSSLRLLLHGAALILVSAVCFSQPRATVQSFVGTWTLSLRGTTCRETIEFLADGTAHVVSGSEDSISGYAIAEVPKRTGSYVWFDWILKNNGRPDCLGNLTPVGDKAINYLLPNPSGGYMLCSTADGQECIGVMSRTAAGGAVEEIGDNLVRGHG
jgi:hypothetical protein